MPILTNEQLENLLNDAAKRGWKASEPVHEYRQPGRLRIFIHWTPKHSDEVAGLFHATGASSEDGGANWQLDQTSWERLCNATPLEMRVLSCEATIRNLETRLEKLERP